MSDPITITADTIRRRIGYARVNALRTLTATSDHDMTKDDATAAAVQYLRTKRAGSRWKPICRMFVDGRKQINVYCHFELTP